MKYSINLLRIIVGLIFLSHGLARFWHQSIPSFGEFLLAKGLPFGIILAYVITILEIVGGLLLVSGKFVIYCVIFHSIVILGGIIMVHLHNGWFVVGHGQGGVEYSVLLLTVLFYLYSQEKSSIEKIKTTGLNQ